MFHLSHGLQVRVLERVFVFLRCNRQTRDYVSQYPSSPQKPLAFNDYDVSTVFDNNHGNSGCYYY